MKTFFSLPSPVTKCLTVVTHSLNVTFLSIHIIPIQAAVLNVTNSPKLFLKLA